MAPSSVSVDIKIGFTDSSLWQMFRRWRCQRFHRKAWYFTEGDDAGARYWTCTRDGFIHFDLTERGIA